MEKFSKVIILLIVFDMCFKSDMVEGGRGNSISKLKFVNQPQSFPGFRNWNFPTQQKPGNPDNIPGLKGIIDLPGIFGFPPGSPGSDGSIFPFLPYFSYDPPGYCVPLIGCIPIPGFLLPPPQGQATPVLSPPDHGPLSPTSQPLMTNESPFEPVPVDLPPAETPLLPPMAQIPAVEVPTVPDSPIQSPSAQAEAFTPPSPNT